MIDPLIAVVIAMVIFGGLLLLGAPIFAAMGVGGIIGIFLVEGLRGLVIISTIAFTSGYSFTILAVTLFVFMGNLIVYHEIGQDMYDVTYKWFGWVKGGLAIASTMFGAMFGFMCGSSLAGVATVGGICLPEMEKRGYDRRLSTGTLSLAGSLAALIPPSLMMIIYSLISEASLGKLFTAGIVPGILLAIMMSLYVFLRVAFNPQLAPAAPAFPWKERVKSLVHLIPVIVVFLGVIGGLYMGIWSAIEAGATGAVVAFLICLIYRRASWGKVKAACLNTIQTFAMIYMLLVGASLIAHLFFLSGVSAEITAATTALTVPSWLIVVFMWLVMMILGCFLDAPGMIMITLPIFLPIVESLGYDTIWFGVIMVLAGEMAGLTPPVGMSLFIIHSIAPKGTTLMDVVWAAVPYVGILWLLLLLLLFFPDIAMWLPGLMRGG